MSSDKTAQPPQVAQEAVLVKSEDLEGKSAHVRGYELGRVAAIVKCLAMTDLSCCVPATTSMKVSTTRSSCSRT